MAKIEFNIKDKQSLKDAVIAVSNLIQPLNEEAYDEITNKIWLNYNLSCISEEKIIDKLTRIIVDELNAYDYDIIYFCVEKFLDIAFDINVM